MTSSEAHPALFGCDLSPLDSEACERYLAWLLGQTGDGEPEDARGLAWALAHCDDGVTWGRYDGAARAWRLGSQVLPGVSPPIRREMLQELRIFGETGEVLIWRTEAGLHGRFLRETDPPADRNDESNPLRPSDEPRILRGDRVIRKLQPGFTHIGDGTGAEQVIPLTASREKLEAGRLRIKVRHYYEADEASGAVRIAATRLVELTSGEDHGA